MGKVLDKVKVTNSGYLRICHECNDCKDTLADLPTEGVEIDTRYFVYETELYYTWTGTEWVPTGGEFDLGGSGGSSDLTEINERLTALEQKLETTVFYKLKE